MKDVPTVKQTNHSMPAAFDGEIFNNVGKYARSAVLFAFEQMGGAEGLAKWGKANEDDFYTKLFPKIIARESEVTHHRTVDQLMDVIDGDYTVEGEFDEVNPAELPAAVTPVAHNWNVSSYEDTEILMPDDEEPDDEPLHGVDLVDFEA